MRDAALELGVTALVVVVFIAIVVILTQPYQSWICDNTWQETAHRYVWFAGCQVDTPQGWVPSDNYRVLD